MLSKELLGILQLDLHLSGNYLLSVKPKILMDNRIAIQRQIFKIVLIIQAIKHQINKLVMMLKINWRRFLTQEINAKDNHVQLHQ